MLNCYKLIEIIVSLQSIIISTFIPVYIPLPFIYKSIDSIEIPITLNIPIIILLTLIFSRKVVYRAFIVYLILGLFILPVFHEGGSIGYLLTPNFGYLLGVFPLIKIIDNLNCDNNLNIRTLLVYGFLAISTMHFFGIIYNFIEMIFFSQFNNFLYNLGKYSIGKIGYHLITLIPLIIFIKPINHFKYYK